MATDTCCTRIGPCDPFAAPEDLCCLTTGPNGKVPKDPCLTNGDPVDTTLVTGSLLAASQVMWALTGRQFGVCTAKIRPCRQQDDRFDEIFQRSGPGLGPVPALIDGEWFNLACGCAGLCCCNVCEIDLPYPTCEVLEVKVDGVVLGASGYRVDDWRRLVRLAGTTVVRPATDLVDNGFGQWSGSGVISISGSGMAAAGPDQYGFSGLSMPQAGGLYCITAVQLDATFEVEIPYDGADFDFQQGFPEAFAVDVLEGGMTVTVAGTNVTVSPPTTFGRPGRIRIRRLQAPNLVGSPVCIQNNTGTGLVLLGLTWTDPAADACWPTCFPAGTLITTRQGQVPIEDISVGDEVLTHCGRWRSVLASSQTGERETVTVSARGSLTSTADHPLWARAMTKIGSKRKFAEPEWVAASGTAGSYVARASVVPSEAVSLPNGWEDTPAFWRFVGFWLGDGHTTDQAKTRNYGIRIFVEKPRKQEFLAEVLPAMTERWNVIDQRRGVRWSLSDKDLWTWLRAEFGVGAYGKGIPSWLLGARRDVREAFLDGFLRSDGTTLVEGEVRITTVSKSVAVALGILLNTLGYASSCYRHKNGHWQIVWRTAEAQRAQVTIDNRAVWSHVRSVVANIDEVPVFDIEVAEDHSFIADGFVVHNCQDLALPDTEAGTWSVTLTYGRPVPEVVKLATAEIACELLKSCVGDSSCRLPQRVQSVTRQGVTVSFLDPQTFLDKGRTGFYLADSAIKAFNPHGLSRSAQVWSPDASSWRTVSSPCP